VTAWRCFVAVSVGEELRRGLASAIEEWRRRPDCDDLRWTDASALHLTLAFLGSVEPSSVEGIRDAIRSAVEGELATTFDTGGVGAFPSARRARVAWYGVADPTGTLERLSVRVRAAARLPVDIHPFRPHVTLARTRGERAIDLCPWVREADPPPGVLNVATLDLMRSHLGNGPARYEVLSAIPFRGAVHA
jgi:RNA 2',3'-cyclic 3'-phosphodiesterase